MTNDQTPGTNMPLPITIPRLGWSMDEGIFGEWLKADGDSVEPGEPIFSLESDKAVQDIEAVDGGTLHVLPDGPQEGDTVTVGTLIAFLLEEGEAPPTDADIASARSAAAVEDAEQLSPVESSLAAAAASPDSAAVSESTASTARRLITPRAARLARQLGVDWSDFAGTGRNGRIRERDIRAAAPRSGSVAAHGGRGGRGTAGIATSSIRRTIAERMLHSVQTTAPVTLTTRVDATNLVSLRNQFKAQNADVVPAYHDIIAKLAVAALRRHPIMNCQWQDGEIVEPEGVHIGIAVDTEAGLLVPVIRDCDRLSLTDVARRCSDLITRARERRCSADELSGGTFSITNLGAFGIDAFTPIINTPQTAVLGIGAIRREPVVLEDDRIEPRDILTLSLTFDHQVVDGAPAARFLQELVSSLESPAPFLIG
jgi:pyruvate dehydrogenase E2 component (dihydrolipoamide acetyltransferase)